MIEVGVNSYITLGEAENILQGDRLYDAYSALTQEQKEKLITDAAMRIEALPLSGRKKALNQIMEFPRTDQEEVPYQVKYAQAAEAVCVLDTESESRISFQEQGIASVTIGKVSESYSGSSVSGIRRYKGLHSPMAYDLLKRYIAGSFPIV